MTQRYKTPDGQTWQVSSGKLNNFLTAHPDAVLIVEGGTVNTPKPGIYRIVGDDGRSFEYNVTAKHFKKFMAEYGDKAEFVGDNLKEVKVKKLGESDVRSDSISSYFDDAEDDIVANLKANNLVEKLNIKVEGPDDDDSLDISGADDNVRLTNEWGKTVILNKGDKNYINNLNNFLQKTSDAREWGKSKYWKDKNFKDWGIVTPKGSEFDSFFGNEEIKGYENRKRENERRQGVSYEEWFKVSVDKDKVDNSDLLDDVTGFAVNMVGGIKSTFFGDDFNWENAAQRRKSSPELKKQYEQWKNRYDSSKMPSNLKSADGLTSDEYIESVIGKENFKKYNNKEEEEIPVSIFEQINSAKEEYDKKVKRAILSGDIVGVQKYFGVQLSKDVIDGDYSGLSEKQLEDEKIKSFVEYRDNITDEDKENFDLYKNELSKYSSLGPDFSAGVERDIVTEIFGDQSVDRDDFLEWFENNSEMQGQAKMRFNKVWNEKLGEFVYSRKLKSTGKRNQYDTSIYLSSDEELENFQSNVIASYLSHKSGLLNRNQQLYENLGADDLIEEINEYTKQREALEDEFELKNSEFKTIKAQFENGSLEKTKENINKYNNLIKQLKYIQSKADTIHNRMQSKLTADKRELLEGYSKLSNNAANLKGMQTRFLKQTSIGKQYAEKLADQMATDNFYKKYDFGGILEAVGELLNVVPRALNGLVDFSNRIGLEVEQLLTFDDKKDKELEDAFFIERENRRLSHPLLTDNFGIINTPTATALTDPETGDFNYSQLLPQVTRTVGDMAVMIAGTKGVTLVARAAGNQVKKGLLKAGASSAKLGTIGGKVNKALPYVASAPGSIPVLYPMNLDEAYKQISEDFTPSDALDYATYATSLEAIIEVISPDILIARRAKVNLNKIRKSTTKGKDILDAFKNAKLKAFKESLKSVAPEILEEFIQEASVGVLNRGYNIAYGTDFSLPEASNYRDTAVLTALSVLTLRGLSGNLLRRDESGLLRLASENADLVREELNRRVKLDPKSKEYISSEDAKAFIEKLETYQLIQSDIVDSFRDEDGKYRATDAQVDTIVGLVTTRQKLETEIENAEGKQKEKLQKELDAVNQNIKNQRNVIKSTSSQRDLFKAQYELIKLKQELDKERKRKRVNKSAKKENDLNKAIFKKIKEIKDLRSKAPEYSINNKTYKNREEFLKAINAHKMNGDFKRGVQLKFHVKDDFEAESMAYKIMNRYAPNSLSQKGGQAKVVMTSDQAADLSNDIETNKSDEENKREIEKQLNKELLKKPENQNKQKIQRLRDVLSYIKLKQDGYVFGTKGFLVQPPSVKKVTTAILEKNIEAVKEATESMGVKTRVLTTEQIEKEFKNDIGSWAKNTNGFFAPVRDKNGNVTGFQFIINKETAESNEANSVASHEMLHGILSSIINGPMRKIVDKNGKTHFVTMTEKGKAMIEGVLDMLTLEQKAILNAMLDKGQYRFAEYDPFTGKGVEGTELPFEVYGEEYLNHLHDAVVVEKTISLDKNLNIWQKIAKFITSFFKKEVPEYTNVNIETPQHLFDFLKSFNKQTLQGKFNEQIIELGKSSLEKYVADKARDKKNKEYQAYLKKKKSKTVEIKPQRTNVKNEVKFDNEDKNDLFSKTNEELNLALETYGLTGKFDRENPQHVELWNNIPQEEKLFIGYSIGVHWKAFMASKLDASKQAQLFNYDVHRDDIIDVLTQGIETNNNGLPYLVRSWDPTKRALTSHLFGELGKRIPHVTQLKQFASLGATTSDVEFDISTGDVLPYSDLKPEKRRKIKSLSDINMSDKEVISSIIRTEIDALLKDNPVDLNKKLSNLIKKDVLKAVKTQMGPITKKVEGFVTDQYKEFLALNYSNIIEGLDTPTIKKKYNQLFDLTLIGKEDKITRKTDKPTLKKDSRFKKGIYKIETNKAKFTKYFTEGKYTTLVEKQKGLANIIAEGITEDIINNEIINNSTNIDAIIEAELREFSNSLNRQKKETQGNFNDQIKYSREIYQNTFVQTYDLIQEIYDANVITDVFNLDEGVAINKKYSPWVERTVFEQWSKGLVYTNREKAFVEALKKTTKKEIGAKRSTAAEQFIIDRGVEAAKKYPGLTMLGETVQEGGIPDFYAKVYDYNLYAETKFGKARAGKMTINYINYLTSEFRIDKPVEGNTEFVEEGVKRALARGAKDLVDKLKTLNFDLVDNKTVVDLDTHDKLSQIMSDKGKGKGSVRDTTVMVNGDYVARLYTNKEYPVFLIEAMGGGLYYMEGDAFTTKLAKELGIPKLEGNFPLTTRILASSKKENKVTVGYRYGMTAEPTIDAGMASVKSPWTLTDLKTFDAIMQSQTVKQAGKEYAANIAQTVDNAIMSSRSSFDRFQAQKQKGRQFVKNLKTKEAFDKFQAQKQKGEEFVKSIRPEIKQSRGITILDFDDTLATSKSQVISTSPEGVVRKLTAEEFAKEGADLLDQGWTHDFSEFSEVIGGKVASLFNKALKLQKKFGPENMFVLTARPANSANSIFEFLKANGLNIPLENITGLGNSTSEAKALWVADKVAEGYNDFYFADDALQNVQAVKNMLDQFDVKSKVQQAYIKFSRNMNKEFNDIINRKTGIDSKKVFSDVEAKLAGRKSKYKNIIPPSAQDFMGLLYNLIGKGKQGEADFAFFKKALVDPFSRGIDELNTSRQTTGVDYKNLLKKFPDVKKLLSKKIEGTEFTYDQAIRVYLWNKAGYEIPGISERDLNAMDSVIKNDTRLQDFADQLGLISKSKQGYVEPGEYWYVENINSDLLSEKSTQNKREYFLQQWQQNVDAIFTSDNLNKIEAVYGSNFREALEEMLYTMKTGTTRKQGTSRLMGNFMNWVNGSVGAIMFFNIRSAVLQTISATNYINWTDNNPLKAAAAFANQKQFWADFVMLFNSNYLKQRRAGNQRGINEAELSQAVQGVGPLEQAKAAIRWLLKKGFLPTQIADSFAIASGGAAFYRNRVNKYIKDGMSKADAESQAFLDFQETTEVSQQSSRPDMLSQQQKSPLGRLILSFQNTPMQYSRIMEKAGRDLIAGRGDAKTHISKIAYYGVIQSILFGALQSAIFAAIGDDDEEQYENKKERILNQMIDSALAGIGFAGKAISTAKNTVLEYLEQRDKGFRADHAYTLLSALSFSPPIGSKLRKIYSSIQTEKFNRDVMSKRGFTLDNPVWSAIGHLVEGVTNIPLGRMSNKMLNVDNSLDSNNETWQRLALLLGWNTWDLGIKDPDIDALRLDAKQQKQQEKKLEKDILKQQKLEVNKKEIQKNKNKKDGRCAHVSVSGKRCKKEAINGGFCTIHEVKKQRKDNLEVQCRKIKKDGKRCQIKTKNRSGLCYYHD